MSYYAATALIIVLVSLKLSKPSKLDAIPTVGSNTWIGSWWAALKYLVNALDVLQEGYEKYKSAPFKVAELHRWTVILSNPALVEELGSAPDDILSFEAAVNERFCVEYTIGPEIQRNPNHASLVHSTLTRNIATVYPEMRDELIRAFDDMLDLRGNEWKGVPAFSTMQKIISRTSNRLFVRLPLCRNPEWIDLITQNAIDIVKGGAIIRLFPDFLKPVAARFLTNVNRTNQRARDLLRPTIEERRRCLNEYGNEWADKPHDFLSRLMEEAQGPDLSLESLTAHILAVNFAAILTLSVSFTHVLFYLAAYPQYIEPLREEVEGVIKKEGWSKIAVGNMRKVDSFLKECQRLEGVDGISLVRKVVRDYTFSDGTFVPKGTTIVAASRPVHLDETFYENASTFKPFRFVESNKDSGEGAKHHFVSATTDFLAFGHGRRVCPGRFFAANELKTMLAHIVTFFDVSLEGTVQPQTIRFGAALVPNPTAKVMFRRRID